MEHAGSEAFARSEEQQIPEIIQDLKKEPITDPETGITLMPMQGTQEELALHKKWFEDPEVTRFLGPNFPFTDNPDKKVTPAEWVAYAKKNPSAAFYMIQHPTHGIVGHAAMENIDLEDMTFEQAFMIGERSSWGQGIGKNVAKMLLKHGASKGFLEAYAFAYPQNLGSLRVLEQSMGEKGRPLGSLVAFRTDLLPNKLCFIDERDEHEHKEAA